MTASLPDRLRKAADELESLRCAEDAALMREAAEALTLAERLRRQAEDRADEFEADVYELEHSARP